MPVIRKLRIANPRSTNKRVTRTQVTRRSSRRRRRTNSGSEGGELEIMTTNPSRRRRRSTRRSSASSSGGTRRRRRRNPFGFTSRRRRSGNRRSNPVFMARRRRSGRRRNPGALAVAGYNGMALIKLGAGAAGGAIATRALTQMVLKDKNTGYMGYGVNFAMALALGWVAARFVGNDVAAGALAGGIGSTIMRIWNERVSQTSPSALSGLGDVDFSDDGLGMYLPSTNPPAVERGGYYQVTPGSAAPVNGNATIPSRLQRRF